MQGRVHVRFLDGNQGLADVVQGREVRGSFNRVNIERDMYLQSFNISKPTLMLVAPSGRMTLRVKFSATMESKS